MRLKKFLFALLAVTSLGCSLVLSGCSEEDPLAPRESSLLVYVGEEGLYSYSEESGDSALLVEGEHIYSPKVSPDGRYIYYNNSSDIFVIPSSGGTPTLAAAAAKFSGFHGNRLLSCSASGGVNAYDPDTGVSESMFPTPEEGFVDSVLLSPDSTKLAACVRFVDVGIDRPEGVYIRYSDRPGLDCFTSESICGKAEWLVSPLCWSADSGTLLFSCGAAGQERTELFIQPVIEGRSSALGGKTVLFKEGSDVSVSSDGTHAALLTYRHEEDLTETVCVVDLTRARFSYIPSGNTGVSGTALSSDGSLVAYTSGTEGGVSGLYVYANDTTLCVVGGDGKAEYAAPKFTADGMHILFIGFGERLLAQTDSEGNAVGTYTETVASVYSAVANTSGSAWLVDGVRFPDGVYTDSWYDMFDYYEYIPQDEAED